MWYVYFLLLANGDVYVGHTHDLRDRIAAHESGRVASTKGHLPLELRSCIAVRDKQTALELERYFRSGSGKALAYKRLGLKHPGGAHAT